MTCRDLANQLFPEADRAVVINLDPRLGKRLIFALFGEATTVGHAEQIARYVRTLARDVEGFLTG